MRKLLLGAICASSFLVSGYTGCGDFAKDFEDDMKEDFEGKIVAAKEACTAYFEAKASVGQLAAACYTADEIEARLEKPTEADVAECAARHADCDVYKQGISETTSCFKSLNACADGEQEAFELAVGNCDEELLEVKCGTSPAQTAPAPGGDDENP